MLFKIDYDILLHKDNEYRLYYSITKPQFYLIDNKMNYKAYENIIDLVKSYLELIKDK